MISKPSVFLKILCNFFLGCQGMLLAFSFSVSLKNSRPPCKISSDVSDKTTFG